MDACSLHQFLTFSHINGGAKILKVGGGEFTSAASKKFLDSLKPICGYMKK